MLTQGEPANATTLNAVSMKRGGLTIFVVENGTTKAKEKKKCPEM